MPPALKEYINAKVLSHFLIADTDIWCLSSKLDPLGQSLGFILPPWFSPVGLLPSWFSVEATLASAEVLKLASRLHLSM